MFKGSATFTAEIKGNGFTFDAFDCASSEPGVDKIAFAPGDDHSIEITVHLANVATEADGQEIAAQATSAALDRLAFLQNVATRPARMTGSDFVPLDPPPPGIRPVSVETRIYLRDEVAVTVAVSAAVLKANLEQQLPPNERYYGLIRSARQSASPVEEFMHLYNILLMFHNDKQPQVDAFIKNEEATVPQTTSPQTGNLETIYTRLRNEFGHKRANVNLETTKLEMDNQRSNLLELTKKAIALQP